MSSWTRGVVPGRNPNITIGSDRVAARLVYSPGIVIHNREGFKFASSGQIPGSGAAKAFYAAITTALDKLKTIPTGAELISALDSSKHVLNIFRGPDGYASGSCVIPYPGDIGTSEGRFVKALRPLAKNKQEAMKEAKLWISPAQAYGRELTKLFDRTAQKNPAFTRPVIARIMGVPPNWMEEYEKGKRTLEDDEYYRLVLYLYDYLEPGAGSDGEMRVVMTQEILPDEPMWIIIGHELVHAWRIMNGRRIFEGGWEEEAMTTGIPPFSNMKFTENRLRVEAKLTVRKNYDTGLCKTSLLQTVRYLNVQPARQDRPFSERDIIGRK